MALDDWHAERECVDCGANCLSVPGWPDPRCEPCLKKRTGAVFEVRQFYVRPPTVSLRPTYTSLRWFVNVAMNRAAAPLPDLIRIRAYCALCGRSRPFEVREDIATSVLSQMHDKHARICPRRKRAAKTSAPRNQ